MVLQGVPPSWLFCRAVCSTIGCQGSPLFGFWAMSPEGGGTFSTQISTYTGEPSLEYSNNGQKFTLGISMMLADLSILPPTVLYLISPIDFLLFLLNLIPTRSRQEIATHHVSNIKMNLKILLLPFLKQDETVLRYCTTPEYLGRRRDGVKMY